MLRCRREPQLEKRPVAVTDCYHLSLSAQCKRYAKRAVSAFAKAIKSLCYSTLEISRVRALGL